jgi:O-antigen/teichoic acid export membrane protein
MTGHRTVPEGSLLRAFIGSGGVRVLGAAFAFLVGVQLARMLGSEGYGQYGLVMSILTVLTIPAKCGLPQLAMREVVYARVNRDWGLLRGIQRWASTLNLVFSTLVIALVLAWVQLFSGSIDPIIRLTLLVGLVLVPLLGQINLREGLLQGLQHIVLGQLPDTLIRTLVFSALLFLAPGLGVEKSPVTAMALAVLAAGLAWIAAVIMQRRVQPPEARAAAPRYQGGHWLRSALPMALTEGMRVFQGHLVILVLGVLSTAVAVGVFRVASSVATIIALPISLFDIVGAPLISGLYAENETERLQRLLRLLSLGMLATSLAMAIPIVLFGEQFLGAAFGEEFIGSYGALVVLCGGAVLNACFGPCAVLLNMTGQEKRVTRASLVALLFLAVILFPLIHFYDSVGAALGNLLSMLLWRILMWRDACSRLKLNSSVFPVTNTGTRV